MPSFATLEDKSCVEPPLVDDGFRALFDANFDYVLRSLQRLGVRDADLDDIAQELFVRVHERLPTFDQNDDPRPWLFSFAVRIASNYRRLARHRREVTSTERVLDTMSATPNPEELVVQAETRTLVLRALDEVPLDRRAVFILNVIDGLAAPAIAKALGIPTNTVYSRLRVGRAEFASAARRLGTQGGTA